MVRLVHIKIIKCFEVMLQLSMLYFMFEAGSENVFPRWHYSHAPIHGGYCLVLSGIWAGILLDAPVHRRCDLYFSLLGCLAHFCLGFQVLHVNTYGKPRDLFVTEIVRGTLSIFQSFLFLADIVFTIKSPGYVVTT